MQSLTLTSQSPRALAVPSSPFPNTGLQLLTLPARIRSKPYRLSLIALCSPNPGNAFHSKTFDSGASLPSRVGFDEVQSEWTERVGTPSVLSLQTAAKLSLNDQAFFLLAFIGCTTSVAFMSLVAAAVPTLFALARAANSLSKLADTAREELPSTMAAVRLSGMEISDLTMELSDLSQEISEGVTKSAQAVQAAEAGIRQIGALARQQTMSMIQERASLPIISLQPVVVGAAKKTSQAVGQATKSLMNMISGRELGSEGEEENAIDRVEF